MKIPGSWFSVYYSNRLLQVSWVPPLVVTPAIEETTKLWVYAAIPGLTAAYANRDGLEFHVSDAADGLLSRASAGGGSALVTMFHEVRGNNVMWITDGVLPQTLLIRTRFLPHRIHLAHLLRVTEGRLSNAIVASYPVYAGRAIEAAADGLRPREDGELDRLIPTALSFGCMS